MKTFDFFRTLPLPKFVENPPPRSEVMGRSIICLGLQGFWQKHGIEVAQNDIFSIKFLGQVMEKNTLLISVDSLGFSINMG